MKIISLMAVALLTLYPLTTLAGILVPMNMVNIEGVDFSVGKITVEQSDHGLVFTPDLKDLTPGLHGFHLHEHPSCMAKLKHEKMIPGLAAGGHYDPSNTGRHGFPWGDGHLGDLPPLSVNMNSEAKQPVLAPRLKLSDMEGRSLVIHAGGDNHSDHPARLGGGGARMACGTIP